MLLLCTRLPIPRPKRQCLRAVVAVLVAMSGLAWHAASAAPPADNGADFETRLRDFVIAQVAHTNARVTVTLAGAPARYARCRDPHFFLPARQRRIAGAVTVGVRCPGDRPARRYYPVRVGIEAAYVVAARDIGPGDVLAAADLRRIEGDITRLGERAVTDAEQLVGRVVQRRIAAGMPVLRDMTAQRAVVDRGESVRVIAQGHGFSIATDGLALDSAASGERLRVRTRAGATIQGRARADGTVALVDR